MPDGKIEPTFRWRQQLQGAHAGPGDKEHNQHGIGVCLVGDFERASPSPAQLRAVKRLVRTMKAEYGITSANVIAHRDIRSTECPGRYFPMTEVAGTDSDSSFSRVTGKTQTLRLAGGTGSPHQ
jgi:N-acetyl-anhydromuramyl-L-alanine amidase AmpD